MASPPLRPYYQDELTTLYHGSCLDVLASFEDAAVDLTLTDPPYGNNTDYGDTYSDSQGALATLVGSFMPEVLRVSKRTLLTPGVSNMWLYPRPAWALCWHIPAGVGRHSWGFSTWQPILAYGKDPYLANRMGARPDSLSKTERSPKTDHPCPKPVGVWTWLLERGSVSTDDVVLDPFAGSGTTLLVAKQSGRRSIGIELSEAYCEIAAKRLANA